MGKRLYKRLIESGRKEEEAYGAYWLHIIRIGQKWHKT